MKRIIILIGTGIVVGSLLWILWTGGGDSNILTSLAGNQPSEILVEMPSSTPFQPQTNTPTPTASPTVTSTPIPSPTPTATLTFTPSPTVTSSSTPTPTMTPTPPNEATIEGIKGRWPAFSLSCEARSAVDWGVYFGIEIDEIEFQNALPVSDNPDIGFVGNVNAPWGQTPPNAYGVHAGPVAELLKSYGLNAQARSDITFDELRAEISAGRPVIVWVVGRVGSRSEEHTSELQSQFRRAYRDHHWLHPIRGHNFGWLLGIFPSDPRF